MPPEKREFRIFISSTSKDLEAYRIIARELILSQDWFPVAMEYFASEPVPSSEIIERYLNKSDVLVLIAGASYGSRINTNKSYVEWEFEKAQEKGLPVVRLIMTPEARKRNQAAFNISKEDYDKQEQFIARLKESDGESVNVAFFRDEVRFTSVLTRSLNRFPHFLKRDAGLIPATEYQKLSGEFEAEKAQREFHGMLTSVILIYQSYHNFIQKRRLK